MPDLMFRFMRTLFIILSCIIFMFCCDDVQSGGYADLAVINANIITAAVDNPRAEAIAVRDGYILAAGHNDRIQKLVGEKTTVIDARGKTVTPGFYDAHMHPAPIYPFESVHHVVDLSSSRIRSVDALVNILKQKARITPAGGWIRGTRYQDTKIGRHPTRYDLDRISTRHPIRIRHSSGHISVFNSFALERAGIGKSTPDPPGGAFDRDKNGVPNGICREGAASVVTEHAPAFPAPTREELIQGYIACFNNFIATGITSIADASVSPSKIEIYKELKNRGMPVRVNMMIRDTYLDDIPALKAGLDPGSYDLRIGPVKIFHGNSLSGRTCWLREPYDMVNPKTGRRDYYGIPPGRSQEELDDLIYRAHAAGLQVAVHSNGDREIPMVLEAIEKALKETPRGDHRHRIEHCSVVNTEILEKVRDLGVVLALHSYVYEHGDKMEDYGAYRWGMMHPNRTALDMGILVAGNSDYGVSAADPLLRIQSMVTRKSSGGKEYGPAQKITVEEAIRVWTIGSAFASFEEDVKGSIEEGKLADFVILSEDPSLIPPKEIRNIKIEKTIIGGRIVFDNGGVVY